MAAFDRVLFRHSGETSPPAQDGGAHVAEHMAASRPYETQSRFLLNNIPIPIRTRGPSRISPKRARKIRWPRNSWPPDFMRLSWRSVTLWQPFSLTSCVSERPSLT